MASKTNGEDIDTIGRDFLTCSLCLDFYQNAKTLPCLHSYCQKCLDKLVEKQGELSCPQCRKQFDHTDRDTYGTNHMINGLVEFVTARGPNSNVKRISSFLMCDGCDDNIVVQRCIECQMNLCTNCVKAHSRSRATKQHQLIKYAEYTSASLEQVTSYRPTTYCSVPGHEGNAVQFYCDTCQLSNCVACTVVDHRVPEHKHRNITDVVTELKTKLNEPLNMIAEKQQESIKSKELATNDLISIRDQYEQEVNKVKTHYEEIITKVEAEKERLIGIVKKDYDAMNKYLECEIDRYEIVDKDLTSARNFVDVLIKYGSEGEIVSEFKRTINRIDELLNCKTKHQQTRSCVTFIADKTILSKQEIVGAVCCNKFGLSETTLKNIPKELFICENVDIDVTTVDLQGDPCCLPTVVTLSARLRNADGTSCDLQVTRDDNGRHTVKLQVKGEGEYSLTFSTTGYPLLESLHSITVKPLQCGMRVIRGRDWKWGDQDIEPGKVMKIYEDGRVAVMWNNGQRKHEDMGNWVCLDSRYILYTWYIPCNCCIYRMGAEDSYDLKPVM